MPDAFFSPPRVLVAPLDWGLGHATRCVPIVRALLAAGAQPLLAGEGAVARLLSAEFPQLPLLPLPGYRVSYPRRGGWMVPHLMAQMPQLRRSVAAEHRWLKETVAAYGIQGVVSDNRYGLHGAGIPSVILTHQLRLHTDWGAVTDAVAQRMHYRLLRPFDAVWVPDAGAEPSLAGKLSHPRRLPPVPIAYTGPLSRLQAGTDASISNDHLVILLSGPEPLRTQWEAALVAQLHEWKGTAVLIRGLPLGGALLRLPAHVQVYDHLPADALAHALAKAEYVVARCGYSTVMDLMAMGKRGLLVPTPGQGEQQYLASHLHAAGLAYTLTEKDFRLSAAVSAANNFHWRSFDAENSMLQGVVAAWVQRL